MRVLLAMTLALFAGTAVAQEETHWTSVGDDQFSVGFSPSITDGPVDDAVMFGSTVTLASNASGDAILAGETVEVTGNVESDIYAAGGTVSITGDVSGDASLFGQTIEVAGVGGDLRAIGEYVTLNGAIAGNAIVGGAEVTINAPIAGDLFLGAENIAFADGVTIGGTLHVYQDPQAPLTLPNGIEAEIVLHDAEDFPDETRGFVFWSFLSGVLTIAVIAALIAAIAPRRLAAMRRNLLAEPFRSAWIGFLGMAALIGGGILVALSLIGLLLTPGFLIAAGLLGLAGYIVGTYSLGVGLLLAFGQDEPETLLVRAGAALVGALSIAVIALAPFIGWIIVMLLTLAGSGVLLQSLFRPQFFVDRP